MGFGPFYGTDMFGLMDTIKGNTNHAGSNDPNNPYFTGGSGNLFAQDIYDKSNATWRRAQQEIKLGRKNAVLPDAGGLMPYQRAGVDEWMRNLFANGSATASARGMNLPQNYSEIVGSTMRRAAPNLFAIQNENQFLPEKLIQQKVSTRLMPLDALKPMIEAGSYNRGPGTGYNNLNQASSNWWDMMNKVGSFWGTAGGGKLAA